VDGAASDGSRWDHATGITRGGVDIADGMAGLAMAAGDTRVTADLRHCMAECGSRT
jgi:hypothetical protein